MKIDGGDEVGLAAEAAGGVLDALDLGVERLAGGVGDGMPEIGDDVVEAAAKHAGLFDHGFQAGTDGPVMPPIEVFPCCTDVVRVPVRDRKVVPGIADIVFAAGPIHPTAGAAGPCGAALQWPVRDIDDVNILFHNDVAAEHAVRVDVENPQLFGIRAGSVSLGFLQ